MAYAFTKGDTMRTTRMLSKPAVNHEKNSMKGMRGFIKTSQDKSSGGLKDSSGVGPHREGPIGKKTGATVKNKFDAGKFRGSSDNSYRATSTGAGKVVSNKGTPHARGAKESEGPQRGKSKSGFQQYGGGPKASFRPGGVGAGKMESLRGRAKFSMER